MIELKTPMDKALASCMFWGASAFGFYQQKHVDFFPFQVEVCLSILGAFGAVAMLFWSNAQVGTKEWWVNLLGFLVGGALIGISGDKTAFLAAVAGVGASLILAIALQPRSNVKRYS